MKSIRFSLFLICLVAGSIAANAQTGVFMKVTDPGQINGESVATLFPGWTEINEFNAGSSAQPPVFSGGGGGGAYPAVPKCFTISMNQDKMAYYLKKQMFTGSSLVTLEINFTKTSGGTGASLIYYKVQMENIYVTAIEEAGSAGSPVTMNVSFVPQRFRYTYYPQLANGSLGTPVVFGWDNATNTQW